MPLFLKNRLLFIHIPKCGGDTVTHHLRQNGDSPFLFVADGAIMVNGHTPQHMTWRELQQAGWITPPGFRVVALVRHPVDRVISEFNYIKSYRPDLAGSTVDPTMFLDEFLSPTPAMATRFDNHSISIHDFLSGPDGKIDPAIETYPLNAIDQFMASLGLAQIRVEDRRNVTNYAPAAAQETPFTRADIRRIEERYGQDIEWLQEHHPDLKSRWQA